MILKAAAIGFVVWLVAAATFRLAGHEFFYPSAQGGVWGLIAAAPLAWVLTVVCLRLLRVARGDEAEAAIGLCFPGVLLDVVLTRSFVWAFPNLDASLDGEFGALKLFAYGNALFVGLLLTRLAPQDERI